MFGVGVKKLMTAPALNQLPLPIKLNYCFTWEDFCWDGNEAIWEQLQHFINNHEPQFIYLWGATGCGKSHLLQAIANLEEALYLPLGLLKDCSTDLLDGLENQQLLLFDDLDKIAGLQHWEVKLFELFNKIYDAGTTRVLIANDTPPNESRITLPDLKSRMHWGLVMQLQEMNHHNKAIFLKNYAAKLGFELTPAVAEYLLTQYARDMAALLDIMHKLDKASLMAKRKITIPFVKSILELTKK